MSDKFKKGLISVIMPVWKPNFRHLKESLNSILAQTYQNLEIIIVYTKNKAYDEQFNHLMNNYSNPQIKILNSPQGITFARNEGITNSKGQYVAFMDADDISEKSRLEKQLQFKKDSKCDVVASWGYNISNDGKIIGKICYPTKHDDIRKKFILHNLILNSSVLMDRKIFESIGLFNHNYPGAEDYEFWLRAMSKGYKFANIPEFLIRIRESPHSITRGSTWRKQRLNSMKVRTKALLHYGFCTPQDISYHMFTPFSYFISPGFLTKIKKTMGWYH